jgi:tRNA-modifying protein YgfZ
MPTASEAARTGALICPQPGRGCLEATGPDRATWLNGIVTADVLKVAPGTGCWALALTKQGKILSDLAIVASADALFVSTSPGTAADLRAHFDRMLVMEDAEIADRSDSLASLDLHGPEAPRLARIAAESGALAAGVIDWSGLGGASIVVSRAELAELATALVAAGAGRALLANPEDCERLRIERAIPRHGVDYDGRDNPHEASLDQRAVSWSKGCYLGQEVVCMQDMRGKIKRRIEALLLDGGEPPAPGTEILTGGRAVGEITSAAWSEVAGKPVVLARLQQPLPEGRLEVAGRAAAVLERGL